MINVFNELNDERLRLIEFDDTDKRHVNGDKMRYYVANESGRLRYDENRVYDGVEEAEYSRDTE